MATKVFTPQMFITTSEKTVESILSKQPATVGQLFDSLSEDDLNYVLYSPRDNKTGLLEARFSFSDKDFGTMTLKLVELSDSFERFFDSINYSNFIVSQLTTDFIKNKTQLNELFGLSEFKVYVSYGVGENLNDWCKFYKYTLGESRVTFDDFGMKIIEMIFFSDPNPYLRINSVVQKITKLQTTPYDLSLNIDNDPSTKINFESDEIPFKVQQSIQQDSIKLANAQEALNRASLHLDFAKNEYNSQVKKIEDSSRDRIADLERFLEVTIPSPETNQQILNARSMLAAVKEGIENKKQSAYDTIVYQVERQYERASENYSYYLRKTKNKSPSTSVNADYIFLAIHSYLEKVLKGSDKNILIYMNKNTGIFKDVTKLPKGFIEIRQPITGNSKNPLIDNNTKVVLDSKIKISSKNIFVDYSKDHSITKLPNWFAPLRNFSSKVTKDDQYENSEYVLHIENNIDVLNLMKKHGIIDNTNQVVIFAPLREINKLYLRSVVNIKEITPDYKSKDYFTVRNNNPKLVEIPQEYFVDFYTEYIKSNLKTSLGIDNQLSDMVALDESANKLKEYYDNDGIVFTHNTKNSNVLALNTNINLYGNAYNVTVAEKIKHLSVGFYNQNGIDSFLDDQDKLKITRVSNLITTYYKNSMSPSSLDDFTKFLSSEVFTSKDGGVVDILQNKIPNVGKAYTLKDAAIEGAIQRPRTIYYGIKAMLGHEVSLSDLSPKISNNEENIKISKQLEEDIDYLSSKFNKDYFFLMLAKSIRPDLKATLPELVSEDPQSKALGVLKFDKLIKELCLSVEVKTVPFYNLQQYNSLGRTCILYSLKNMITGTTSKINSLNPFTDTYSIMGIEHVISPNECYSTFTLAKASQETEIGTGVDGGIFTNLKEKRSLELTNKSKG